MTQKFYDDLTLDELKEIEQKTIKEIVYLDNQNLAVKVLLNSIYGTFANKHSSLMDIDNATSITMTGQNVAKAGGNILDEFVKKKYGVLSSITKYGDTDSLVGETIIQTNLGNLCIADLYKKFENNSKDISQFGHEILDVSDNNLRCLTYNSEELKINFGKIKKLVRHTVTKGKYKVCANGNEVIMTEDHGCMVWRGNKLLRLPPKQVCKYTDKFVVNVNRSPLIVDIASVEHVGEFDNEYVYDIEMDDDTEHTFFANDILVHNSVYVSIDPILQKQNIPLTIDGKVNEKVHKIVDELDKVVNTEILEWARKELFSIDPRYVFKREVISDVGIFLQKKRYILHVLDEEGVAVDKFKYTGIELVRSTTPKKVKKFIEKIIQTALLTQNSKQTNEVYRQGYTEFLNLDPNEIAVRTSINNLEKYAEGASLYKFQNKTPSHVKGAIAYNILIKELKVDDKYELIQAGQKVKKLYCAKNKYGLDAITYVSELPQEFNIKIDWDKMFSKLVTQPTERLYEAIGWSLPAIGKEVQTDLFDMFGD
jgi:DNA polymerase elongation subunit (family B)